jgi:hypothetical protein
MPTYEDIFYFPSDLSDMDYQYIREKYTFIEKRGPRIGYQLLSSDIKLKNSTPMIPGVIEV